MATVVLFHSVFGLRQVETAAADRIRGAGHFVIAPDLYDGRIAASLDDGFEIVRSVGWERICGRAQDALQAAPDAAVLAGHSMGVGVIGTMWPDRPLCGGVIMIHGLTNIPGAVRRGTRVAVHVADPDPFAPPDAIATLNLEAEKTGMLSEVFLYPGAGHFYTDATLPDYDAAAAARTWERVLDFLGAIASD